MMKKNGFTLVEIMVVVIIVGILAAVGVPKLFGVIAKAKAAEVPVAAGTYISLQNTYLHENNGVGSWKNIGYGAPGNGQTDNFIYQGCIQGLIKLRTGGERMVGWQAFNIPNLNYCNQHSAWSVILNPLGEHEVSYEHIVSSAECAALTLNWNVGNAGEGACEATGEMHEPEPSEPSEDPENNEESEGSSGSSSPSSSGSTGSSESQSSSSAVDCEALMATGHADDPRQIKGNKCGWCYVTECRLAVNKGHLDAETCVRLCDYEKDHDVNKEIEEYEEEQRRKEQEQQQSSNSGGSSASGAGGGSGGTGGTGGGSGTGGGGSGTSHGTSVGGSSTQPASSAAQSAAGSSAEESASSETPVIKDQNGHDVDFETLPDNIHCNTNDCCTEYNKGGKCKKYGDIPKSQCAVYNTNTGTCTQTVENP